MIKYGFAIAVFAIFFPFFGIVDAEVGSSEIDARRATLRAELSGIEKEIETQKGILNAKQREAVSLERDVAILDTKINRSKLSIKARTISISGLNTDINSKQNTIDSLSEKLAREKQSLSQLIRKTNEMDSFSLVEVVLSNENLSEFFIDIDSFGSIKESLNKSFDIIEKTKNTTSVQKDDLEEKKLEEVELRAIQELQKKRIVESRVKRNRILRRTKGQEKEYKKILNEKEKSAASIRSELFTLRGTAAIPFGKALDLANLAFKKTGVRPALILAIITEETNLGENVGTGNWRVDMKNPRDTVPFLAITKRLGFNPDKMPVSKKPWYGWGGAMGPAQFIPSTWVLFESRIAKLTGHNPPNPWDPSDAFMASALLLEDNGAAKGGYTRERLAALRYFAGWKNAKKRAYAFYGDDVMELTAKIQRQVDILKRN